jgi:hypothetical protein
MVPLSSGSTTTAPAYYDLNVRYDPGGWFAVERLAWRELLERGDQPFPSSNRGIRLLDDRIDWIIDGRDHDCPFNNIAQIRLSAGPVFTCRIRFRDGSGLRIYDGDGSVLADRQGRARYRDFVLQLHERLLLGSPDRISLSYLYRPDRSSIRFFHRWRESGSGKYLALATAGCLAALLFFGYGVRDQPKKPGLLLHHPPSYWWFILLGIFNSLVTVGGLLMWGRATQAVVYDPTAIPDRLLPGAE